VENRGTKQSRRSPADFDNQRTKSISTGAELPRFSHL
jgi:hypothetical protein